MSNPAQVNLNPGEITKLLQDESNPEALNQVISMVYKDLRRIAGNYLKGSPNRSIAPTALVHEAYRELAERDSLQFNDRSHFFGCAAMIMRHRLFKYARDMKRLKRGGSAPKITLEEAIVGDGSLDPDNLLSLEIAMNKLKEMDAAKHQIVELRSFLGLTMKEIAQVTERPLRSIERDWQFCRIWLARELEK